MPMFQTIAMGSAELKGGTTKIGEIDPAVVAQDGSTSAKGELCNKLNVTITDYDVSLKKANTSGLTTKVKIGAQDVAFDANGVAHFDHPTGQGLGGNICQDFEITGLKADTSGLNIVVNVTPSSKKTISGALINCNVLPEYSLDSVSDQARNGILEMYHACALGIVNNADASLKLATLSVSVGLLDVSGTLTNVYFTELDGTPIPNAVISRSGNNFTISGFDPLRVNKTVMVAMLFDEAPGGTRMQAQLTATFTP